MATANTAQVERPATRSRKPKAAEPAVELTAERLRELLSYDPATGAFTHRVSRGPARAGASTGTLRQSGYIEINIASRVRKAHRLAWLYVHGRWPACHLDHVNGNPGDNRIANLRECTAAENQQNKARSCTNSSGHTGVTWHRPNRKWVAQISVGGRKRCLGYFHDKDDAAAAYRSAKAVIHTFQPTLRGN